MIDRKIRNIVTNCEIVGDDGQNVFVKLYNDYDQKGR